MNRKLLKGGTVVSGSGSVPADVLIEGEKIAAVGTGEEIGRLADGDTEVVDVSGCLLFPGFIDAHTHFDLHVAGTVTADDFETGTTGGRPGRNHHHRGFRHPVSRGRPWPTALKTGMRRRTGNVPATTASTCPSRTGIRR